jgi:integrase
MIIGDNSHSSSRCQMFTGVPHLPLGVDRVARACLERRPLSGDEFHRMIDLTATVREHDADAWKMYLKGLWLSGLRLVESRILSWDEESSFAVDLSGRHPRFRIYGEAEKGGKDRYLPMTPDFAELLSTTSPRDRFGFVFPMTGDRRQQVRDRHGWSGRFRDRREGDRDR